MTSVTTLRLFHTRLIFIVLALITPLVCIMFVKVQQPQVERDTFLNLATIAQLKAQQIEKWLYERDGDTAVLMESSGLSALIEKLTIDKSDTKTEKRISNRFQTLISSYGYDTILVLDSHSQLIVGVGKNGIYRRLCVS